MDDTLSQNPPDENRLLAQANAAIDSIEERLKNQLKTKIIIAVAPWLIIGILIFLVVAVVLTTIQRPSLDSFDIAFQCGIQGLGTNQECVKKLIDQAGTQLAPEQGSTGSIAAPTPTYSSP